MRSSSRSSTSTTSPTWRSTPSPTPATSVRLYELTGPRLLTFADAAAEIAAATGRPVEYRPVTADEFQADLEAAGLPAEDAAGIAWLFGEIFDGRNESLADGVQQALGRPARDFSDYARRVAATGVWSPQPVR